MPHCPRAFFVFSLQVHYYGSGGNQQPTVPPLIDTIKKSLREVFRQMIQACTLAFPFENTASPVILQIWQTAIPNEEKSWTGEFMILMFFFAVKQKYKIAYHHHAFRKKTILHQIWRQFFLMP